MRGLLRSGGMGFLVAVAVSLLVIGGLWAVARTGPSAKSARAPMVAPTPTPEEGQARLGQTPFPTSRPIPAQVRSISARTPAPAAPGWGLPRRRSALPTPTGWELLVGTIRDGDATGADPGGEAGAPRVVRPLPTPTPARFDRTEP